MQEASSFFSNYISAKKKICGPYYLVAVMYCCCNSLNSYNYERSVKCKGHMGPMNFFPIGGLWTSVGYKLRLQTIPNLKCSSIPRTWDDFLFSDSLLLLDRRRILLELDRHTKSFHYTCWLHSNRIPCGRRADQKGPLLKTLHTEINAALWLFSQACLFIYLYSLQFLLSFRTYLQYSSVQ